MPAERTTMRQVRDVLRLKFAGAYRPTRSPAGLAWRHRRSGRRSKRLPGCRAELAAARRA